MDIYLGTHKLTNDEVISSYQASFNPNFAVPKSGRYYLVILLNLSTDTVLYYRAGNYFLRNIGDHKYRRMEDMPTSPGQYSFYLFLLRKELAYDIENMVHLIVDEEQSNSPLAPSRFVRENFTQRYPKSKELGKLVQRTRFRVKHLGISPNFSLVIGQMPKDIQRYILQDPEFSIYQILDLCNPSICNKYFWFDLAQIRLSEHPLALYLPVDSLLVENLNIEDIIYDLKKTEWISKNLEFENHANLTLAFMENVKQIENLYGTTQYITNFDQFMFSVLPKMDVIIRICYLLFGIHNELEDLSYDIEQRYNITNNYLYYVNSDIPPISQDTTDDEITEMWQIIIASLSDEQFERSIKTMLESRYDGYVFDLMLASLETDQQAYYEKLFRENPLLTRVQLELSTNPAVILEIALDRDYYSEIERIMDIVPLYLENPPPPVSDDEERFYSYLSVYDIFAHNILNKIDILYYLWVIIDAGKKYVLTSSKDENSYNEYFIPQFITAFNRDNDVTIAPYDEDNPNDVIRLITDVFNNLNENQYNISYRGILENNYSDEVKALFFPST